MYLASKTQNEARNISSSGRGRSGVGPMIKIEYIGHAGRS
jgi:hypothetical protein